jgi:beta-xylosidase
LLVSNAVAAGPGHGFVVNTPGGQSWFAYHAWLPGHIGGRHPGRKMWLSRITWTARGPVIAAPSTGPQPAPA